MAGVREDIMRQLRQEILLRQGFRPPSADSVDVGLGPVAEAFPQGVFPTGAIHEMLSEGPEGAAASSAFSAAIAGRLMTRGGACIWICQCRKLFPPGLAAFGLHPDQVMIMQARREKDLLWIMEEALKCEGLACVVGEIREVSAIASRRLQLCTEQSRVTGFLLRDAPRNRNAIAAVARWQIRPVASEAGMLPGVGHFRWQADLLKIRNGQPGSWILEWRAGRFHFPATDIHAIRQLPHRKTG